MKKFKNLKLREFISIYSQGQYNVHELKLDDFLPIYDNGAFGQYDNFDDFINAIRPLLDKNITYKEYPNSQDVEIDVYINGKLLFNVVSIDSLHKLLLN